jgi:PilZ domain-containing protein
MSLPFLEKTLKSKQRGWRRRHERYRADFPIQATLLREEGYLEIQGRCSDIGQGGMGAVLTAEIPKGEVLSLRFQLFCSSAVPAAGVWTSGEGETRVATAGKMPALPRSQKEFLVSAAVRYRKGFIHGVEFLGLSAEQQQCINQFCEGLMPID